MRIAIVGQTASGKSALSVSLAHALEDKKFCSHHSSVSDVSQDTIRDDRTGGACINGVVSADAYQLYRLMDIGTAKISQTEQANVPHYQLDVLDIHDEASVAAYQRYARKDCESIEKKGGIALLTGGSGLYIRAVTDNLQFPGTDPHVRADIQARGQQEGWEIIHDELRRLDPVSAERIPVNNTRRVARALEVCILTGRPFSATLPRYEYKEPWIQIGITWPQEILNERIERRTRAMFDNGWLDEISVLMEHDFLTTPTAQYACGYPHAVAVWKGTMSLEEGIEAVNRDTVRLTKRQWKWFKRDPRIHWIHMSQEDASLPTQTLLNLWTKQALEILKEHGNLF